MTFGRSIGFAWALAATLLMFTHSAAAKGGKGGNAAVAIDAVQFSDLRGGVVRIEILGGGFENGAFPVVTLDGGIELDVVAASDTQIDVDVPRNTPDGTTRSRCRREARTSRTTPSRSIWVARYPSSASIGI